MSQNQKPDNQMGYTMFYDDAKRRPDTITWKEIFSDFLKPHTQADMDYALLAGSSIDRADESNMLVKWEKPWIFWRVFLIGLGIIGVIYLMMFAAIQLSGASNHFVVWTVFNLLFVFIPPLVFPVALMIFFWELNIPRNISIYQMFLYFLVGGILALLLTVFLGNFIPDGPASFAPFSEEPGKLLSSAFLLALLAQKKHTRLYGLTGLAVGAAVGAGFGAFESAQYAYNSVPWNIVGGFFVNPDVFQMIAKSQLIRGALSIAGHTLYCAPYAAAITLHMKSERLGAGCFFNSDFAITFGCSCLMHFIWNSVGSLPESLPVLLAVTLALWVNTLYITRKCLNQAVNAGDYRSGDKARHQRNRKIRDDSPPSPAFPPEPNIPTLSLMCVRGELQGERWFLQNGQSALIGREKQCDIRLHVSSVSRNHCVIQNSGGQWVVRDMGSRNGTYLKNGQRLPANIERPLQDGETLCLGNDMNAFQVSLK